MTECRAKNSGIEVGKCFSRCTMTLLVQQRQQFVNRGEYVEGEGQVVRRC